MNGILLIMARLTLWLFVVALGLDLGGGCV
jgi:hypothetical protein